MDIDPRTRDQYQPIKDTRHPPPLYRLTYSRARLGLLFELALMTSHVTSILVGSSKTYWTALSRYLDDGAALIDNNWAENQIRPWALRSGKRAAAIMSLIQSARLNGHDPYVYLKDILMRLPTHQASDIAQLPPHRWQLVSLGRTGFPAHQTTIFPYYDERAKSP